MSPAADLEAVDRLERKAVRSPRLYRFWLAVLAVVGDVALTVVLVVPWAVIVFFGVVFANRVFFYWLGGAFLLFLVWLLRPTFRPEGRELQKEEAPELFALLDALGKKLQVGRRMRLFLDDSFNAGAAESRGLFGLFGTERILFIGLPLLMALSRDQVMAVVAHEFGHFSRRHGLLGHWLYRARVGWLLYARNVEDSDSSFDRAAAWYAKRFVPYFSVRCFVHSRRCEYEADADAASVSGGKTFAATLARVAAAGRFWEEFSSRKIFERLQERSEAPDNFFDLFAESIREASPQELQEELDVAFAERSGFTDTHPALTDRLAALGEAASLAPVEVNAVSVLGDGAASLVAEFNRRWNQRERTSWSLGHFRMKHIAGLLVDADAALAARWNVEKRLARARVLRWLRPAIGLQELRSLRDEHPTHTLVLFSYGSALLNEDDSAGVEIVRSVAKQNPILRVPAYSRLLAYFDRKGDFAEIERWSTLARRAYQRQNRAVHDFVADVQSGRVAGTSLPEDARAVLGEAVTADPCVKRSWLFSGVARLPTPDGSAAQTLVHALVLCLDPEVVKSSGQEEDMVRNRYEDALYSLIWPGEIAVVMSHFTTEIAPQGCRPELAMERK